MVHACNSSTREAEADGFKSRRNLQKSHAVSCPESILLERVSCIPGWLQIVYIAENEFLILALPPSSCCDYRCVSTYLVYTVLEI